MIITNLMATPLFIGSVGSSKFARGERPKVGQGISLAPFGSPGDTADIKDWFWHSDPTWKQLVDAGRISVVFSSNTDSGVTQPELDAAIAGVSGGSSGVSAGVITPVLVGQPVYMTPAALYDLAVATHAAKQNVLGFSTVNALTGFPALVVTEGGVTRADWTLVAGTMTLTPGAAYYLGTVPGTMSVIAPSGAGVYLRQLGRATGTLSFDIEIGQSILLA